MDDIGSRVINSGSPLRSHAITPSLYASRVTRHALRFIVLLLFIPILSNAQNFEQQDFTDSKKAWQIMSKASDAYQKNNLWQSLMYCDKAIEEDSGFIQPYILKGDVLSDLEEWEKAVENYEIAIKLSPDYDPFLIFVTANAYFVLEDYSKAKKYYSMYLQDNGIMDQRRRYVSERLNTCVFRIGALAHPVAYDPLRLDTTVNSADDEYINSLSTDGTRIMFTRKTPLNADRSDFLEQLLVSFRNDTSWQKAFGIDEWLNNFANVGAATFSPDGQYLFFTACQAPGNYGSCDLYMTRKLGDSYAVPVNLGPLVNTIEWESQPCLSSDGRSLYFASKRYGGKGGSDIWVSEKQEDGSWSRPMNLGGLINTRGDEMAPIIHQDGKTLYFSSRGHTGMGGYDLFMSKKDPSGYWTAPINVGYPINTPGDEINLILNVSGDKAFISAKRDSAFTYDIYEFLPHKDIRPEPVTFLEGKVYDSISRKPLEAFFELIDLESGNVIIQSRSNPLNGEFLVCLPLYKSYGLNVSKKGYLFYSDHFNLDTTISIKKNIPLQKIQQNSTIVLNNIFFDTDKYDLKPESMAELDRLFRFLNQNRSVSIEIGGHTDSIGTANYNKSLSLQRADAVKNYLSSKGIAPERINTRGYGFEKPIASNDEEEGRALNRRTEITIINN